jgi:hypothetical protein
MKATEVSPQRTMVVAFLGCAFLGLVDRQFHKIIAVVTNKALG